MCHLSVYFFSFFLPQSSRSTAVSLKIIIANHQGKCSHRLLCWHRKPICRWLSDTTWIFRHISVLAIICSLCISRNREDNIGVLSSSFWIDWTRYNLLIMSFRGVRGFFFFNLCPEPASCFPLLPLTNRPDSTTCRFPSQQLFSNMNADTLHFHYIYRVKCSLNALHLSPPISVPFTFTAVYSSSLFR